jgi:putative MFS transporter
VALRERSLRIIKVSYAFAEITTWALPVELFPTDLRASAHGFARSFSRVGAATRVFLLPVLRDHRGIGATLLLTAAAQIIAFLTTVMMACEPARPCLEETAPPPARVLIVQPACGIAGADQR